jgi:hypothetical protein
LKLMVLLGVGLGAVEVAEEAEGGAAGGHEAGGVVADLPADADLGGASVTRVARDGEGDEGGGLAFEDFDVDGLAVAVDVEFDGVQLGPLDGALGDAFALDGDRGGDEAVDGGRVGLGVPAGLVVEGDSQDGDRAGLDGLLVGSDGDSDLRGVLSSGGLGCESEGPAEKGRQEEKKPGEESKTHGCSVGRGKAGSGSAAQRCCRRSGEVGGTGNPRRATIRRRWSDRMRAENDTPNQD